MMHKKFVTDCKKFSPFGYLPKEKIICYNSGRKNKAPQAMR